MQDEWSTLLFFSLVSIQKTRQILAFSFFLHQIEFAAKRAFVVLSKKITDINMYLYYIKLVISSFSSLVILSS